MEQSVKTFAINTEGLNDSMTKTINRERQKLRNFIRRRVSDTDDAEDILQDVFYQFANIMQLESIEKAASWLFKTASNRITDWYRKRRPLRLNQIKDTGAKNYKMLPPLLLEDILFDPGEDPDQLYMRSIVWPMLSDALNELPEEQREVFVMHELDGFSFKEISSHTGIPVNTLISRKRYAVLLLRERLKELYEEFF